MTAGQNCPSTKRAVARGGFNGNHLGWFVRGIVWDHDGDASCAIREHLQTAEFEPFKAFKPFKSFRELPPLRPLLSNSFGAALLANWIGHSQTNQVKTTSDPIVPHRRFVEFDGCGDRLRGRIDFRLAGIVIRYR